MTYLKMAFISAWLSVSSTKLTLVLSILLEVDALYLQIQSLQW